jgi:hypothetical protein
VILFLFLVLSSCNRAPETPPAPQPAYRMTASIQDLMLAMVDKEADTLWNSVATIISRDGVEERQPRTDEEWLAVRNAAVTIAEASNLLQMPGRQVALPGFKSKNPGIELEPEQILKIIQDNPAQWAKQTAALHDVAVEIIKVIDERNVQGLLDTGEKLDKVCEDCHLVHWYPKDKRPAEAPSLRK